MKNVLFINQKIEDILTDESYINDMNYYEELYQEEMEVMAFYKEYITEHNMNAMENYLDSIQ